MRFDRSGPLISSSSTWRCHNSHSGPLDYLINGHDHWMMAPDRRGHLSHDTVMSFWSDNVKLASVVVRPEALRGFHTMIELGPGKVMVLGLASGNPDLIGYS